MERAESVSFHMGEKRNPYILYVIFQEEECWAPALMGIVRQLGTVYILPKT